MPTVTTMCVHFGDRDAIVPCAFQDRIGGIILALFTVLSLFLEILAGYFAHFVMFWYVVRCAVHC